MAHVAERAAPTLAPGEQDAVDQEIVAPTGALSVAELLEMWLAHARSRGRSPTTLAEARRSAAKVIGPSLGKIPISALSAYHVDEWMRRLADGEGRARPLSAASVRRHHAVLRAALAQAVRWGLLEANPANRASAPGPGRSTLEVPSRWEIRQLRRVATEDDPHWGMLVTLALLTGARRGELCALRWEDLEGSTLWIRRSRFSTAGARGEKAPKAGTGRAVALSDGALDELRRWRARCESAAAAARTALRADAYLVSFDADGSRPVSLDALSHAVRRAADTLGLGFVHLHSLRHFCGTELLGSGLDARNVAAVLGHSDGGSLLLHTYAHATAGRQAHAAEILAGATFGELAKVPDTSPAAGAYRALVELQGGRCALCGSSAGLALDRDPRSGAIRGLLCPACLGVVETATTEMALAYRRSPPAAELRGLQQWPDTAR